MIVDLILDRFDGEEYSPREFYFNTLSYGSEYAHDITRAMDCYEEIDVKRALATYIIENEYNLSIIDYIYSVNWID